jgi:hypothetical protein
MGAILCDTRMVVPTPLGRSIEKTGLFSFAAYLPFFWFWHFVI